LVGGVAANKRMQEMLKTMCKEREAKLYVVDLKYSGDNGGMIAWLGLLTHISGEKLSIEKSIVRQKWRTDEVKIIWVGY